MKIGFLGNTNNYPLILALALKRLGHQVAFIVDADPQERLNRPEFSYYDISYPYPEWIQEVGPLKSIFHFVFLPPKRQRLLRILNRCDAVVLNGFGHAIKPFLKSSIPSISLLTGADLEILANHNMLAHLSRLNKYSLSFLAPIKTQLVKKSISLQREGIRQAFSINYWPKGIVPFGDELIQQIRGGESRRTAFMMTDISHIPFLPPPQNPVIRIFNVARFTWHEPLPAGIKPWENKGNDIMIRGIGRFYRETGEELDIHFVEKGASIPQTKALVQEEGFGHLVTWHSEMTQDEVFEQYRFADVVFEQLGKHLVCLGGLDAMAMGRPVIANGRPEFYEPLIGEKSPICQARSAEDVCEQLKRLFFHQKEREQVGKASREYVSRYFSADNAAQECLAILKSYFSAPKYQFI
jgi:glycosyltransferase involved in cell wall biosynthesis